MRIAVSGCALFGFSALAVSADDALPSPLAGCAMSGASSVFIGGAPALRLSDVVHCPADLYEIVPGIMIEGQPLVRVRSGSSEKADCATKGETTVTANSQPIQRLGDVSCTTK
ncbi:hypothetical protein ADU59_23630 [Pararhizobium polonicum]|uniref:PAAR motif-containing protein n=2 Tax=Pararhizobium polonicum TaxID=1612624 RepID=A0A1C7NVN8_9HYPH|nr:hypothetical protein ADU59_23630 [Pararhizobium polonicum]